MDSILKGISHPYEPTSRVLPQDYHEEDTVVIILGREEKPSFGNSNFSLMLNKVCLERKLL